MKKPLVPCTLALAAATAGAHVTLEQPQAAAGSAYKAVLRVGHGCAGSPTHTLTVRLPEGLRGAKPMPKPGWAITIRSGADGAPKEVGWRATSRESWIDDAYYDEFVLRVQLPMQPGPLWFKVLQQCEKGDGDWSEVPAGGTSTRGLKAPAVLLEVLPAAEGAGGHGRH